MEQKTTTEKTWLLWILLVVLLLALAAGIWMIWRSSRSDFVKKADALRNAALPEIQTELTEPPCDAGFVVFFSVCDTRSRARVYHASGDSLRSAWDACVKLTDAALSESGLSPTWVKADIVVSSRDASEEELHQALSDSRSESFRSGISFDGAFSLALLEEELNATRGYDYDEGTLDVPFLNAYLQAVGQEALTELPTQYTLFDTVGWFCDEDGTVYDLLGDGLGKGRRSVDPVDDAYTLWLIEQGNSYLLRQIQENGAFNYGIFPRFDLDFDNYNIVRHAGAVWALACGCRLLPDETAKPLIERAVDYLLTQVRYIERNGVRAAYLYEADTDSYKLGGSSLAILALTEYMDVFGSDEYRQICCDLGEGILQMRGEKPGTYIHVLHADGSVKEEFSTVFFDGEAAFALCRMYGLTGEQKWLDAACAAVDRFIADDYTQYHDHWVAYSLNEITKYVTDRPEYFAFALRNVEVNVDYIASCDTAYPTHLEFLMASFEVYDRMVEQGMDTGNFDVRKLIRAAEIRVDRQINCFFYPEFAMYMQNPARIVNSFMVRSDTFRVRIDDVQHNLGGLIAYYRNYDRIAAYKASP